MNTNHALISVTVISVVIRIDTRVDVVAVICRDIKAGTNVRFPLFLYISLRVGNECEQVFHRDDLHSLGGRSALLVLPERDLDGHGVGKMWDRIRWGWLEVVGENWKGYWGWGGMVDRDGR